MCLACHAVRGCVRMQQGLLRVHHAPRVYTVRGAGEAKQRVVKLVWPDRDGGCNEADVLEALQRHPHARAVPLLSRTDVMVGGHRAIALSMPLVPHDIGHGLGASDAGTVKAVIRRLLDITRVSRGGCGTGSVRTFVRRVGLTQCNTFIGSGHPRVAQGGVPPPRHQTQQHGC